MRPSLDSQSSAMPFILSRIIPAIAIGIFFWLGFIIFTYKQTVEPEVVSLKSWQAADAPFGIPIEVDTESGQKIKTIQHFDPRFHFHTPWERASIPKANHFEATMGSESWSYTYNAQPFNELNKSRGGNHSGDDINGIGGQNSDLGDPVYATANGLVVYVGNPSPGWGNCVILAHRTPDGKIIQSMYAHMLTTHVHYHQQIARGTQIGSVGRADVGYLAHLHLEMREADGVSPFLSGYPTLTQHDRLNPTQVIQKYSTKGELQLAPSFLSILQKNRILPELEMDPDSIFKLQKFMRRAKDREEKLKAGAE